MPDGRLLSTGDIAKETGLTRQRVWQLAAVGRIPAERARGKQYRFYESDEFENWRKQQATRRDAGPASRCRAQRISRRRRKQIERLLKILEEKRAVDPGDKELAAQYLNIIYKLVIQRVLLLESQWPLLEGVQALVESKFFRAQGSILNLVAVQRVAQFDEWIRQLPTRAEVSRPHSRDASD